MDMALLMPFLRAKYSASADVTLMAACSELKTRVLFHHPMEIVWCSALALVAVMTIIVWG